MTNWFVLEHPESTTPTGPHDYAQMAMMVASGKLGPHTRVARVGAAEWGAAVNDPELAALFEGDIELSARPPFSFSNAASLGWRTFTKHWVWLVISVLLYTAIATVLTMPLMIVVFVIASFAGANRGEPDGAAVALFAGALMFGLAVLGLLMIPLAAGFSYVGVAAVRGKIEVMDLFVGYRKIGPVIGTGLLLSLTSIAITLVTAAPLLIGIAFAVSMEEVWPAIVGGVISVPLLLLEAIFLSVFLSIPLLLVVDPRVRARGGVPALSLAWELGKGTSVGYFLVVLVYGLIATVSGLCCSIFGQVLFGAPLVLAVQGAAYELIVTPHLAKGPDSRRHA